jgi:hypothetical protein
MCANIYPPLNLTMLTNNEREKISPYVGISQDSNWEMLDAEFLQTISEHWLTRRQVYRALFIQKCPKLIELDHITIDSNDRSEGDLVIGNFRKSHTPTTGSQPSY